MQLVDNIYKIYNFASIASECVSRVRVCPRFCLPGRAPTCRSFQCFIVVNGDSPKILALFKSLKIKKHSGQRVTGIPGKPMKDLKDQIGRVLFVTEAMIVTDRWRIEMSSQCNNVHKRCMLLT